ncbi:MAG: ArsR family transcriptional regulator [Candidatus Hydrothermarchaeales archaeon]
MRLDEILDMLGNETRREILQLLSERPCYITELSQELNVGQKAVIEHLELMRQAGMLRAESKKIEKGRPRKYYGITQALILEIRIGQDSFDIASVVPGIDEEILESMPNLKLVTQRLEDATNLEGKQKIMELELAYEELQDEEMKLVEAKKIIEYLLGEIKNELKKEAYTSAFF